MKLITELSAELKDVKTRVERLETLEFQNIVDNAGCVTFVDHDSGTDVTKSVSVPGLGALGFPYTHVTIFWFLRGSTSGSTRNLLMRINGIAADYQQAYKYTKGGSLTQVGLDNQSEWFVGRIAPVSGIHAFGHITVPFHPLQLRHAAFGDWTHHELTAGANAKQEKGEWGGHLSVGIPRLTDFTFFASTGSIVGEVYLYGWCPIESAIGGPID